MLYLVCYLYTFYALFVHEIYTGSPVGFNLKTSTMFTVHDAEDMSALYKRIKISIYAGSR